MLRKAAEAYIPTYFLLQLYFVLGGIAHTSTQPLHVNSRVNGYKSSKWGLENIGRNDNTDFSCEAIISRRCLLTSLVKQSYKSSAACHCCSSIASYKTYYLVSIQITSILTILVLPSISSINANHQNDFP